MNALEFRLVLDFRQYFIIQITDSEDLIREKCKKAVSDSEPHITYEPERRPAVSNLVDLYCAVTTSQPKTVVERGWDTSQLKSNLADAIEKKFGPVRERAAKLEKGTEVRAGFLFIS